MKAFLITIDIKPERKESFIKGLLDNARSSAENEPGCLRFDVLQDDENSNRIYLYEVYRDAAAIESHSQTPHLRRWHSIVKDSWYAKPMGEISCTSVFPTDDVWR